MTIQLTTQILVAERDLRPVMSNQDARFVPTSPAAIRTWGARLIRASAEFGLRVADRIDPGYRYA
jgi:hypothetical protein